MKRRTTWLFFIGVCLALTINIVVKFVGTTNDLLNYFSSVFAAFAVGVWLPEVINGKRD